LGVPYEVYVHDYAWFCPRIALVQEHSYCGEPAISGCETCIADYGRVIEEPIPVAALVARSMAVLGGARRVLAPGADVASRLVRHFPKLRAEVSAWEDDAAIARPPLPRAARHICIIGGIGVEKGYEVLLACVRDAFRRKLNLRFTLVGHSCDDERLLAAGPIAITGRYDPDEAESLIRAQGADIAFLPSIWPETWCFTLGHAWRAGLQAVVFDLGTPAERMRRSGWGWVLPLGLPPAAVNDWLVRLDAALQQGPRSSDRSPIEIRASSRQRNAVI
jgi:glycosyltransferase involved in cell wall biosynthesis